MTKEVLLSIKGLQYEAGESNGEIETITPAEYYSKKGNHYVLYDAVMEGFGEPVKNRIKFREDYLEVTQKGTTNLHMVFEEKKRNIANYITPYGEIILGVDTSRIQMTQEEERILVQVEYALDVNDAHMADCVICVEVREKKLCEPSGGC